MLWDMGVLTAPHERALNMLFSEIERSASAQFEVLPGTPGTLTARINETGTRFWVHRYSDALNRRQEVYLGKADNPDIEHRVSTMREMIATANATIARVRLLARAGFATIDRQAYFTLADLHNRGLFRAGALLVGAQAHGALLNALGVRATRTGTHFKERGGGDFKVDLLVPSADETSPSHAQGLPYLPYLFEASQQIPVLSPHGSVMVRVPVPARYAIHRIIMSQLRKKTRRPEQDLLQAATLIEALVERCPGAIEDAASAVPKSAARHLGRGIKALEQHLPSTDAPVWETLHAALKAIHVSGAGN
jgi:hypothetical protein